MDLKIAMILLFHMVVGILGNFSLMYHYTNFYFHGCRSRSTDLILSHLTVANSLVILSRGIPGTIAAFGLKDFLDVGCELVSFLHRVSRGVSIGTTCLLSVFQAIIISPKNSRWAKLKLKVLKYVGPSNILYWIMHILVNTIFPIYMLVKGSNKTLTKNKNDWGYCSVPLHDNVTFTLYAALISSRDVLFLGLMAWTSGSMVFILYKHKQRVQHIRRNNLSPQAFPETRASQNILVLVSTFVPFYALFCIIYAYLAVFDDYCGWLVNISALITACFPTISPFVLSSDPLVLKLFCVCCGRNTQFPPLTKKTPFVYLHHVQSLMNSSLTES
ncbi:LOW QUALITY PROTEIN: vomeronasal type-1 receptor 2-like [Trichechus manatus latirostris]|uniref:Vomeronasal type-1 receptor n=1 Tax=Trichechus manatus latirostris TaxID=127582 RepID=A0A2Y9RJ73_TRIMA|nr:LOW QUALITY PROTEIN: vomeronasal type-1 receptor 2-like [Trichechus manatus latirostris]